MMPTIWAILIGIDFYMPGEPGTSVERPGVYFPRLQGCVEDVSQVEKLLREFFDPKNLSIHRLTATPPGNDQKARPQAENLQPTYENIVATFNKITKEAKPDDVVYIHYSGHGARVKTIFSQLKQNSVELDEALVPTDICCGGRYLRDVEVANLIDKMVEKKLVVTLILDCCHAESANRGPQNSPRNPTGIRGVTTPDSTILDHDLVVISSEQELSAVWGKYSKPSTRNVKLKNHWLLEPRGYAFLAACSTDEYATEESFDGQTQGLLTYNLIKAIKDHKSTNITYCALSSIVGFNVKERNQNQNVVVGGEANRFFLSRSSQNLVNHTARITKVETGEKGNTVIHMDAGSAQGMFKDVEIDIWPSSCVELKQSERIARLRVSEVKEVTLTAKIEKWYDGSENRRQLKPGFLGWAYIIPSKPVYLPNLEKLNSGIPKDRGPMEKLRVELEKSSFVEISDDPGKSFFQLDIQNGNYVILGAGNKQLLNPISPLPITLEGAAEKIARRIVHLSRYYGILDLKTNRAENPGSLIAARIEKCSYTLPRPARNYNISETQPDAYEVNTAEQTVLHIANTSGMKVYIAVIDLDSSWCIEQIYPEGPNAQQICLEAGKSTELPLEISAPDGTLAGQIIDTIKIIVTTQPTSFQSWELPSLEDSDKEHRSGEQHSVGINPRNPFEALETTTTKLNLRRARRPSTYSNWGMTNIAIKMAKRQENNSSVYHSTQGNNIENPVSTYTYNPES
ncbi:hypothetical protein TWF225_009293 [Orbilia oligospora]|nr:hypothetical protein TWF225_009293 [Orbilia oligospora]KAF3269934.1 hypothetical protein TWF217_008277 [Orbilia oligospora]KAF3270394.1 hypothetical protein TWF128_004168 [Orbilia oligospora]KAF3298118.1 hypothetical protein TWF132_004259 [Orbilia oligospora]